MKDDEKAMKAIENRNYLKTINLYNQKTKKKGSEIKNTDR